jgi:hypothetical protein
MTANEPGQSRTAPLSRRQLRELERRRALEESGQDPDAPDAARLAEESDGERPGFAAPVPVDVGASGPAVATGDTELGYEEFTRELKLDQMLTRRELRALYEARQAQRSAATENADDASAADVPTDADRAATAETNRIEAEHEAVLLEPVFDDADEEDADEADPEDETDPEGAEDAGDAADPEDAADVEDAAGPEDETDPEDAADPEDPADPEDAADLESAGDPEDAADLESAADPEDAEGVDDVQYAGYAAVSSRSAAASPLPSALPLEQSPAARWSTVDVDPAFSTSSIVLPAVPSANDMQQALNGTGEIIVTGTIDLPRGLAATGAHPGRYDSAEIDRMLDAADATGEFESEAAPVRASRAIGSQSAAAVPAVPRRRFSLPVVLAGTGGVLIVGVGTLLVIALGMR